jgi:hypothetical protein
MNTSGTNTCPQCQVCLKIGHTATMCWYHFNEEYVPEQRTAAAGTSYDADNNWYTDSSATDHITGELDKLTMHDAYNGTEQIHVANGAGMEISHVGTSIIPTLVTILFSTTFFMFPRQARILSPFINLPLTMICLLNFIPFISRSRIEKRGRCCCTGHVKVVCTLSHHPHPSFSSLSLVPLDYLLIIGIIV